MDSYLESFDREEALRFFAFTELTEGFDEAADSDKIYNLMLEVSENFDSIDPLKAVNMMQARDFASKHGYDSSPFDRKLEDYFENVEVGDQVLECDRATRPDPFSLDEVLSGIEYFAEKYEGEDAEEEIEEFLYTIDPEVNLV